MDSTEVTRFTPALIGRRWAAYPSEVHDSQRGTYEGVHMYGDPDTSWVQDALLSHEPRRISLFGSGLVLYLLMAAVGAGYLIWKVIL